MRKITAVLAVTAIVAAGFPSVPAFSQTRLVSTSTAPVDQDAMISSTIRAFPNAGQPLKDAIADLVIKHPSLASGIATRLRSDPSLTPAQREAIVAGLADALNRMGIVAQASGGLTPLQLALLVAGGGLAGLGIYEATKSSSNCTVSCN